MEVIIRWDVYREGFLFSGISEEQNIPFEDWTSFSCYSLSKRPIKLGPLWRLYQDGKAFEVTDGHLLVPHDQIAKLSQGELAGLGLPPSIPYILHIESNANVFIHPEFKLSYLFWHPERRPVVYYERIGALIKIGGNDFILSEPYYSILNEIDIFNAISSSDLDKKMLAWANLREFIGEEVILDDYLKTINVVRADSFSLQPFINSRNEVDYNPVLLRAKKDYIVDSDTQIHSMVEDALPPASQEFFAKHFRRFKYAKARYPIGNGWFVVVPDHLKVALQIVREYQESPPEVRRRFILNPRSFIKERLQGAIPDDFLEELFQETSSYGERVKDIGLWQVPVLPFLQRISKEPWLPPDSFGVRIGDRWVLIDAEDLEKVKKRIEGALENNISSIRYKAEDIPVNEQSLRAIENLIGELKFKPKELYLDVTPSPPGIKEKQVLLIYGNLEDQEFEVKKRKRSGRISNNLSDLLKTNLLPHQIKGVEWLQHHWIEGSPGALLADDMGLGKTIQVLTFLAWVRREAKIGPFLVIAPTGLLNEWVQQHDQHLKSPGLGELLKAYGNTLKDLKKDKTRGVSEIEAGLPVLDTERLLSAGWILTTYEAVRDYQFSFGKIQWQVTIFDESQKIKSPFTQMTHACKALQFDFAIAMTGTPVENRPADIWCIVDTVRPGELGSLKEFCKRYEKDDGSNLKSLAELSDILKKKRKPPILLRRTKGEYLEGLPLKNEKVMTGEMPPVQAEAYNKVISWARRYVSGRGGMLKALHQLRSVSLHPFDYQACDFSFEEYIKSSARLLMAIKVLDDIAIKGEKALIFLESRSVQGYLAEIVKRRYGLMKMPIIINGDVPGGKRKYDVEKFQEKKGFDVMILSPRAGGVGFTITAANHVIHLSRWWNPAVEDQCTDRVYRISQEKDVYVYYLLARHPEWGEASFDYRLNELLKRKREIYRNILAPVSCSDYELEELYKSTIWADKKSS